MSIQLRAFSEFRNRHFVMKEIGQCDGRSLRSTNSNESMNNIVHKIQLEFYLEHKEHKPISFLISNSHKISNYCSKYDQDQWPTIEIVQMKSIYIRLLDEQRNKFSKMCPSSYASLNFCWFLSNVMFDTQYAIRLSSQNETSAFLQQT